MPFLHSGVWCERYTSVIVSCIWISLGQPRDRTWDLLAVRRQCEPLRRPATLIRILFSYYSHALFLEVFLSINWHLWFRFRYRLLQLLTCRVHLAWITRNRYVAEGGTLMQWVALLPHNPLAWHLKMCASAGSTHRALRKSCRILTLIAKRLDS